MTLLARPDRLEVELDAELAACYADPLRFVRVFYDWPINGEPGPDAWQVQVLEELGAAVRARRFDGVHPVLPIRVAISSGHGIGKSALFAWIVNWLMATRPDCRGTVTANTNDQLEKKTWAAVREWVRRSLVADRFEINSAVMFCRGERATWQCSPQSCAEENSEAFAGQHAKTSSSFYIFDEASAVPGAIWEVAEGGLTDGEPFLIVGGNPTRNTGKFHDAVFGDHAGRWVTHVLDSRTCKFANKALIAEWASDYGEESDFFRVRVRGLPPQASELQFIDGGRIAAAQARVVRTLADEPLVAGVDVSGGGAAWTVCWFRRGLDAASIPPIRLTGEQSQDLVRVADILAEQFRVHPELRAMFIDAAFGASIVMRLRMLGFTQVVEVNFGAEAPDPHYAKMRHYMWGQLKAWLEQGMLPRTNPRLAADLAGPGYHLNGKNQIVLESKESMRARGVGSPDDGDALALTFAQPVRVARVPGRPQYGWLPVAQTWLG